MTGRLIKKQLGYKLEPKFQSVTGRTAAVNFYLSDREVGRSSEEEPLIREKHSLKASRYKVMSFCVTTQFSDI